MHLWTLVLVVFIEMCCVAVLDWIWVWLQPARRRFNLLSAVGFTLLTLGAAVYTFSQNPPWNTPLSPTAVITITLATSVILIAIVMGFLRVRRYRRSTKGTNASKRA